MINWFAVLPLGLAILVGVLWLALIALSIWFSYWLIRTAVKHGILLAHEAMDTREREQLQATHAARSIEDERQNERNAARESAQRAAFEIAQRRQRTHEAVQRAKDETLRGD